MSVKTLRVLFRVVRDFPSVYLAELQQAASRFTSSQLTRLHVYDNVRKLKEVPVDGDTLAAWREPVTRGDQPWPRA